MSVVTGRTLLHNMSAPPRSTVVVAPGVHRLPGQRVSTAGWLPEDSPFFLDELARALGLDLPTGAEARLAFLGGRTRDVLAAARAPAASVGAPPEPLAPRPKPDGLTGALGRFLRDEGSDREETVIRDRLLSVAILSRCSDALFLLARTPRFDVLALGRTLVFPLDTFALDPKPARPSIWITR